MSVVKPWPSWGLASLAGLLGVCLACAETEYTPVTWQLDLVRPTGAEYSRAVVCSARAPVRDFVLSDQHFVFSGLPSEGDVEVVVDFFNLEGDWLASSGTVVLDAAFMAVPLQLCEPESCVQSCVGGLFIGEFGGRSLAVRLIEE